MSRWKRVGICSGIALLLLGGVPTLWYQMRYARPLASPRERVLPKGYSPKVTNGFDTLEEAIYLVSDPRLKERPTNSYPERAAECERVIAANQEFLATTREALEQQFLVPAPYPFRVYSEHWDQLESVGMAYAVVGNLPEALRCALDLIELGVLLPSGGELSARDDGQNYEFQGRQLAWLQVGHVDATTAREAIARLDKIEKRRSSLPESLREELRQKQVGQRLTMYRKGPVALWRTILFFRTIQKKKETDDLWDQVKTVTGGPQSLLDLSDRWVERAQKRLEQPWNPVRPALGYESLTDPLTGEASSDPCHLGIYKTLERNEYLHRTDSALLRDYLMLRIYKLEPGSYPKSMEKSTDASLPELPIDPFSPTHARLHYKLDADGDTFTLWSVGPDAKDDGGKSLKSDPDKLILGCRNGWVCWVRARREMWWRT